MQIQKITQDFFQRTRSKKAFTLVELLMVMVVIMILIGIGLPVAKYVSWRINEERANLMDSQIREGLEQYRMAFGEYPIPGSANHYPQAYINDPDNNLPRHLVACPVDLTGTNNPPLEVLPLSNTYKIDYSLTWPLMLGPMSRGEPPYVTFPEITVTYLLYKDVFGTTETERRYDTREGEFRDIEVASGTPIKRYMAISPRSGKQYAYSYNPGDLDYVLSDNGVQ